ncbi:MAG: hypothetical protein ACFFBD_18490 [Candidatus Hodarchaeota archaeon]
MFRLTAALPLVMVFKPGVLAFNTISGRATGGGGGKKPYSS